ncbi:MAG: aminotransferase, partial [Gammaproteobacteria bacterium]
MRSHTLDVEGSPITSVYTAAESRQGSSLRRLDLAQAAPSYPPAPVVQEHIARIAASLEGSAYTEVPGMFPLRMACAADVNREYGGRIDAGHVVVTAGCNQAFCLAASTVAEPGSEIIVPL